MGDHEQAEFDCREALHRIYHFLDGELTPVRRHEIEAHLDGCSPCLQMFGFEAELRRVVHDKCRDAVPDSLRQRIADTINHEHAAATASEGAGHGRAGGAMVEEHEGV
ncbi:MAG: mycothiol system anti-sigma-R factor [Acidimicrobiales bacterium]|jgi:mycothiol system anti-sigma-R factor